jgi:Photosystem II reaction centre W protein (PsbW)
LSYTCLNRPMCRRRREGVRHQAGAAGEEGRCRRGKPAGARCFQPCIRAGAQAAASAHACGQLAVPEPNLQLHLHCPTAPLPRCRTRSTYHATHAAFFPTQVDDRLNGDGVGHPLGVNEPILGWVIGGVASLIWVLYFIAQRDFGDFGGWQPAAIALHCACLSCLLPTLLSPPNPV